MKRFGALLIVILLLSACCAAAETASPEKASFYQKLADGQPVSILIVADSIGYGTGATEYQYCWASLLPKALEEEYGCTVNCTNLSMGGTTSFSGYVRALSNPDGVAYDLVILCYGQNDSETDFSLYYEALLRGIQRKYPNASVISILQSCQKGYTPKIQAIQAIAAHYQIPVADTVAAFQPNYSELIKDPSYDTVHPNNKGHAVYCETLMNVIRPLVSERRGLDAADIPIIDERVPLFDSFRWLDWSLFTREGNTYTLQLPVQGIVLGLDYHYIPVENSCEILLDGEHFTTTQVTWNRDFNQRRIVVVNDWPAGQTVRAEHEIKVIFAGEKQADGFMGLAVCGE